MADFARTVRSNVKQKAACSFQCPNSPAIEPSRSYPDQPGILLVPLGIEAQRRQRTFQRLAALRCLFVGLSFLCASAQRNGLGAGAPEAASNLPPGIGQNVDRSGL